MTSAVSGPAGRRASAADWIAVFAGIVGAFMAALDISVTNASLPQIQGEIGASGTEGTWITTAYLVAEIVMIPITAWLVRVVGLRRFLLASTFGFVVFSIVCGLAGSLTTMIVGRVGQGFFGGALVPTAMTIIGVKLPPEQQPQGLALFGITVVLAPVFGPVLGGWLTENVAWQWLFLMNVPVGIVLAGLLFLGLAPERGNWQELARADWLGIVGLTLFLGALTIVLEEGQRERWFESSHIVQLSLASALGAVFVVLSQTLHPAPVLKLRLLRGPSFLAAFILSIVMGAAFFMSLYVIPVFLSLVAGYNAEQTGLVAMYSGAAAMALIPFVPLMLNRVDIRLLVSTGLVLFCISSWMDLGLTRETGADHFLWSQIVRGFGQVFIFMPLSQAALAGVSADDMADASGLFNVARNVGGSIGLSLTAVLIDWRQAFHVQQVSQAMGPGGESFIQGLMATLAETTVDPARAEAQALSQLASVVRAEALVMTFVDCFWVLGVAIALSLPFAFLLRKPAGPVSMAH